jgi:hypothetical protein
MISATGFTVDRLNQSLKGTKDKCGLGTDWLEPRILKEAPLAAKQELGRQMQDWEDTGTVPAQLIHNVVKLLIKPDGTDRPITLMPMVIRLLFKMRGRETSEWCSDRQRRWDAAVKESSALRAAMMQKLMEEIADIEGVMRL